MSDIRTTGRPYHTQKDAETFAATYIQEVGAVPESVLQDAYDEYLRELHRNYENIFEADLEQVCSDTKERRFKCLENLSNHGNFEIFYDIVTINVREANRLGYHSPAGTTFKEKWFMTRERAERYGYPVHDTVSWDNNATKLSKVNGNQ